MYLLFGPGGTDPTAGSVKGRPFLWSCLFSMLMKRREAVSPMGLRMLFFCLCPAIFFVFFSEQLQLSLISDVLLRMLTQKICVHLQRYVPKTVRDM